MKTKRVPFDIYIPATENRAAIKVTTIEIEVAIDERGNERVTTESTALIDKTQARYMGILAGDDIKALRSKLKLSQLELSELIGCGKKSLSRWESGHEFPSQLVNTVLRLLEDGLITPEDLRIIRNSCRSEPNKVIHFIQERRNAPKTYDIETAWAPTVREIPMPLAQ